MFSASERHSLLTLVTVYFSRMVGVFIAIPVLAVYAVQLEGYSPASVGIALGILGLTQAVLLLPMGLLSDYWGRKKVLLIGMLFFTIGSVICANAESLNQLIVGRAIQGMGAVAGVLLALTSELVNEENRSIAMAIIGVSIGLSFGVALVSGPFIAAEYGFSSIFWLCAGLGVLCIGIILWRVPAQFSNNQQYLSTGDGTLGIRTLTNIFQKDILSNRQIMSLNGSVFVLHFIQMALWLTVPLALLEFGYDKASHWKLYLQVIGASFIVALPLIRLSDKRFAHRNTMSLAFAVLSVGLLLMALETGAMLFNTGLFLFFTGFCFLEAKLPSKTSQLCSEQYRGATMGTFSTFQFLGLFAGGAGGAVVITYFSSSVLYWLCLTVVLLWSCYITLSNINSE